MLVTCLACGHKNQVPPYYEVTTCRECGKTIVQSLSPPEKPKAETGRCIAHCTQNRTRIAQIKLRGDDGPSGELSPPEKFLQVGDKFYDMKFIQSVPCYGRHQLEFCDE